MTGIEMQLIEWLKQARPLRTAGDANAAPPAATRVALGIGDDMAILNIPGGNVLLSSDMLVDGVHFDTKTHALARIGRKALACSLSDCAAMAVQPFAAVVSVALPESFSLGDAQALLSGMHSMADQFGVAVVGGDTTSGSASLVIDVSVIATPYPGIDPVRRSGARPGDRLFVTGPLGGSRSGRHLDFVPRVEEARRLTQALGCDLHAMIDISDGLSLDLWRVCEASGVGAVLDESQLEPVISNEANRLAGQDGTSPLDRALSDGEDFELLLAVKPEAATDEAHVTLYEVGRITESALAIRQKDGRPRPLEPRGYTH